MKHIFVETKFWALNHVLELNTKDYERICIPTKSDRSDIIKDKFRVDVYAWLLKNIGKENISWIFINGDLRNPARFLFTSEVHAMMFKLAWSG